jgi:D-sedoheptulose 7-phosphate isomerase
MSGHADRVKGPMSSDEDLVRGLLSETIAIHERVMRANLQPVLDAAAAIAESFRDGGKLLLFGNGGSAADVQQVAAEFVGRFQRERAALAAVALTADTSVLSSIGNDYAFERIFAAAG